MELGRYAAAVAAEEEAAAISKTPRPLTDNDIDLARNTFIADPDWGEKFVELGEGDDAVKKAAFNQMVQSTALHANELDSELRNKYGIAIARPEIVHMFKENLLKHNAVTEEGFFLWKSPSTDTKKSESILKAVRRETLKQFQQQHKQETEGAASEAPVVAQEHQQSTGQPEQAPLKPGEERVSTEAASTEGRVAPDEAMEPGQPLQPVVPNMNVNDKAKFEAINNAISKLEKQGNKRGSAAIQRLIAERDKILNRY
jgi:hypothetical protein